jgi:simple sugar transport system permease protein
MKLLLKKIIDTPGISALIILILILLAFQIYTGGLFFNPYNIELILTIWPELGIVVIGVVILMIAREFDLSVGSTFALSPMLMQYLFAHTPLNPWATIFLGLAAAALVGLVNGMLTIYKRIPSFIVTLGMLFIVRSIVVALVTRHDKADEFPMDFFIYDFGLIRASFIWFIGITLILGYVLHRTNFGNWIYATGGQTEAAQNMGIPVNKVKIGCFMLCSVLAGFAGIIQSFRAGGFVLPNLGTGMELEVIAAAVVGGTALFGGYGSVLGALVGALLIRTIDNGFIMSRVPIDYFRTALGLMIIGAVLVNTDLQRWAQGIRADKNSDKKDTG